VLGRRVDVRGVALVDEVPQQRVGRIAVLLLVVPRDVALAALAGVLDEVAELLVVDERLRLLALGDVGELRARERGVEEQRVGAQLRARHDRVDEAAVVAAHDPDAVALLDALLGEGVRERVGALVDVLEGQRPELVDDRRGVRVARGRGGVAARRRGPEADEADDRAEDVVGASRAQDARLDERLDRVQLGCDLGGHLPRQRRHLSPPSLRSWAASYPKGRVPCRPSA
jgi:hypothetical protein